MDYIKIAVHSSEEKLAKATNSLIVEYDTGKSFYSDGKHWIEIPATAPAVTPVSLTVVPALATIAAVKTYLETLVSELKSSDNFS